MKPAAPPLGTGKAYSYGAGVAQVTAMLRWGPRSCGWPYLETGHDPAASLVPSIHDRLKFWDPVIRHRAGDLRSEA